MSKTLKSVSVKIGADTSSFLKELKNADKGINATTKEGNALNKALSLKFDEKQFIEAQRLIRKAIDDTQAKAVKIREEMEKLEKSGKIDSIDYRVLNTELIKTESNAFALEQKLEKLSNIKIDKLVKKIKDVGSSVESVGKALLPLSGIAAGVSLGIIKAGKDTLKAADDIATASDKYTMSAKAIQYWQYIAMQSDVPADRLFKASSKVRDAFGSQLIGEVSIATKTLDELGVNIKNFDNSEDAFKATIESLSAMTDKTLQAKYANDIFGEKIATDLLPLFGQGKDAIKEYNEEFESIGFMSDEQVKAFAELDNEFNKIGEQLKQAKYSLGVALLPLIKEFTTFLTDNVIPAVKDLIEWFGNLPDGAQSAILGFIGILAIAAPLVIIVGKIIGGVGTLIEIFPILAAKIKGVGIATTSAMIGIGALVTAVVLISEIINSWGNMDALQKIVSILGVVAVAALGAAIAFGAFHSAWSLGLAVAGIVSGIALVTAAVNAAKKNIESLEGTSEFKPPNITGGGGNYQLSEAPSLKDFPSGGGNYEDYTNNSVGDINIYVTEPGATATEIAEEVSKVLAKKFATRS